MPDVAQALTAIAAIFAAGVGFAAVLAFYKRKPGEEQTEVIQVGRATIEIAEGSVNIAKSAAEMQREISEQLEKRLEAMGKEIEVLRDRSDAQAEDLVTVKGRLVTAVDRLEGITRERDALQTQAAEKDAEIRRLRDRVQHLEDRVTRFET